VDGSAAGTPASELAHATKDDAVAHTATTAAKSVALMIEPQRLAGIWMPSRARSAALATSATVPGGFWYQPGSLS
jgi:hypothetical protein